MMDIITNEIHTRSVYYRWNDVVQHFAVGRTYEIRIILYIFCISVFSWRLTFWTKQVLVYLPVTELSFDEYLHSSILAECQGTYRSCVEPANKTCLNMCKLDPAANLYIKVFLMSEASFIANWWRDPDFFHFCINHIPTKDKFRFISTGWVLCWKILDISCRNC